MKSIAEIMRQMRRQLRSVADAVRQKALAASARLRRASHATARATLAVAGRERWWQFRTRPPAASSATSEAAPPSATPRRHWAWRVMRYAALAVIALLLLPYIVIPIYAIVNPPMSALMARQWVRGIHVQHEWVDLDDISPHLVRAVLLAEDAAFCRHSGVDWDAISKVLEAIEEGETPRGASTIPMQTAKNLFLWNRQNYLRKGLELPLAYYMSMIMTKRRIAEIYLNVAEWGPGVFGVEAAARYHFRKSASALTPAEASLLAASLPSPIKRRAGRPSAKLARIANHIDTRADREAKDVMCVFD